MQGHAPQTLTLRVSNSSNMQRRQRSRSAIFFRSCSRARFAILIKCILSASSERNLHCLHFHVVLAARRTELLHRRGQNQMDTLGRLDQGHANLEVFANTREFLLVSAHLLRRPVLTAAEVSGDGLAKRTTHAPASVDAVGSQILHLPHKAAIASVVVVLCLQKGRGVPLSARRLKSRRRRGQVQANVLRRLDQGHANLDVFANTRELLLVSAHLLHRPVLAAAEESRDGLAERTTHAPASIDALRSQILHLPDKAVIASVVVVLSL